MLAVQKKTRETENKVHERVKERHKLREVRLMWYGHLLLSRKTMLEGCWRWKEKREKEKKVT